MTRFKSNLKHIFSPIRRAVLSPDLFSFVHVRAWAVGMLFNKFKIDEAKVCVSVCVSVPSFVMIGVTRWLNW